MNKIISVALIACFFTSVAFSVWGNTWEGFELSKLLIIVILSCILWIKLSYDELVLKSLAFIVFLDGIWNAGQFFCNGQYQGSLELVNGLIFIPWLFFAMFRPYEPIGDNIEPNKVYWIASKPKRKSSFFVSLFGSPVGGSSLLIADKVFGFRDGKFEVRDFNERLNIVATDSGLKVTQGLTDYLSSMEGRKWSLMNNCLTMRLRAQLWQTK